MSHFSTTLRKLFLILLLGCWGSRISSEYFKSSKWYGWGWVKGQLDGFHECLDSGNSHGKTFVFLPFWRTLQRLMVRLGFLFFEVPVWCFRLKTSHVIYIFLFDENSSGHHFEARFSWCCSWCPQAWMGPTLRWSWFHLPWWERLNDPFWTVARLNMAVFVKLNVQSPNLMTGGRTYVFRRKPSTTRGIYRG